MKEKEEIKIKKRRSARVRYPDTLKLQVCQEYMSGGKSQLAVLSKYGVRFRGAIGYWMAELKLGEPGRKPVISGMTKKRRQVTPLIVVKTEIKDTTDQSLRVKELERQLQNSQLQAEAYLRIIEFTERELNLPIRKKPNTK